MKIIYLYVDDGGETPTYEALSLACWDTERNGLVWTEGIRRNRCMMWPQWRAVIEPMLKGRKQS